MILGMEKPVDIPVMSVYDKDMMKMYLGALLKDYEQGVADQKEFLNNYNNFVSVMPGATDAFYNAGMKGVNEMYDRLVAQGIDPIRSVEGRNMMAQARAAADPRLMAKIKADSAAYEQYQKAAGALAAKGKFDKALNDWWLKQNGIDPNNWDFSGNKRWDVLSPLETTTIQDLLSPTVQQLAKTAYTRNDKKSKNGYIVEEVPEDAIRKATNEGIDDLLTDPRMKYFYESSGLDKDLFKQKLNEHIAGELQPKVSEDKVWQWKQNIAVEQAKLIEQRRSNLAKEAAAREALGKKTEQGPQLTDKISQRTQVSMSQIKPSAFVSYFNNLAKSAKNPNVKKKYEQYAKEWTQYANSMNDNQRYEFLKKYGYVDESGLTQKFFEYSGKAQSIFRGSNVIKHSQVTPRALENYSNYMVKITGPGEADVLIQAMSGTTSKQKNGYYGVTFGSNVSYTPVRALNFSGYYGNGVKRSLPAHRQLGYKFNEFLKGIRGNVFDTTNISAGMLPGGALEVSGMYVTVPLEKIEQFVKKAKSQRLFMSDGKRATNDVPTEKILSDLGLHVVDVNGKGTTYRESTTVAGNVQHKSWVENKYVMIPTSMSHNLTGSSSSGINDQYNKYVGGANTASKEREEAIVAAILAAQG